MTSIDDNGDCNGSVGSVIRGSTSRGIGHGTASSTRGGIGKDGSMAGQTKLRGVGSRGCNNIGGSTGVGE